MSSDRAEALKASIAEAFADVERPGDWALVSSNEGEEPAALARALKGGGDWRSLQPSFLDALPDGYGSALSFFADEAFRHFLPAFLIAHIDGALRVVDPSFYLTHGLESSSRDEPVNARRYGARTWFDHARARFSVFTPRESAAIVAYLEYVGSLDDYAKPAIDEALDCYWRARATRRDRDSDH